MNKEIKLSDLVRRPKKKTRRARRHEAEQREPQAAPKQEIVGLKIGASQIAASRVVNNGWPAKLVQLARVPLEPGIVVAGEVRNVTALAAALDNFFTENKLPRRGIRLGIGTNRIGVRTVDIDGIDDDSQLDNAVRFRAHEALSIPLDQAVLDYHVVSESVDESGAVVPGASCSLPPTRSRSTTTSRRAARRRSSCRESTSRPLRCCARWRRDAATPTTRPTDAAVVVVASVTTARRSRSRTARSATSCACSTGAARSSRPRSRASSD